MVIGKNKIDNNLKTQTKIVLAKFCNHREVSSSIFKKKEPNGFAALTKKKYFSILVIKYFFVFCWIPSYTFFNHYEK